jgi:hypothetical protein
MKISKPLEHITMFDKNNGTIYFDEGFIITSDLTLSKFKALNDFNLWELLRKDKNKECSFLRRGIQDNEQNKWNIIVYFNGEILRRVQLYLWLPGEVLPKPWTDLITQDELERKNRHDAILLRDLQEKMYEFSWGKIGSYMNLKDIDSFIALDYETDSFTPKIGPDE